MSLVGHELDHVLDHMIIGFVTTALHKCRELNPKLPSLELFFIPITNIKIVRTNSSFMAYIA